ERPVVSRPAAGQGGGEVQGPLPRLQRGRGRGQGAHQVSLRGPAGRRERPQEALSASPSGKGRARKAPRVQRPRAAARPGGEAGGGEGRGGRAPPAARGPRADPRRRLMPFGPRRGTMRLALTGPDRPKG